MKHLGLVGAYALGSAVAGLAVTSMADFNASTGLRNRLSPDGIAITASCVGSSSAFRRPTGFGYGVQWGGGFTAYITWRPRLDVCLYAFGEVGTAPVACFPSQASSPSWALGAGLVFNADDPTKLSGAGLNAYWPIAVMAGVGGGGGGRGGSYQPVLAALWQSLLGKQGWAPFGNWYTYMGVLSRYLNQTRGIQNGLVNSRPGTLYFSTGIGIGDTYGLIGYARRAINFGTTYSHYFGPLSVRDVIGYVGDALGDSVDALRANLSERLGEIKSAVVDPDQLGRLLIDILERAGLYGPSCR